MKRWTIKYWLFVLNILPALAVILGLGGYLTYWQTTQVTQNSLRIGETLVQEVSNPALFLFYNQHAGMLKDLLEHIAPNGEIESVTLFDPNQNRLFYAGVRALPIAYLRHAPSLWHQNKLTPIKSAQGYVFIVPVVADSFRLTQMQQHNLNPQSLKLNPNHSLASLGWVAVEVDRRHILVHQYETIFINLFIMSAGVLLLILMQFRLSHRLIMPLRHIREKLLRLQETHHPHPLLLSSEKSKDLSVIWGVTIKELQEIDDGLKNIATLLSGRAEEYFKEYEQKTMELQESLAELEVRTVEIERDKKNALLEAKAKAQLVANMHHEIKAPLNGLVSFVELLAETHLTPFQNEYLSHARVALRQLSESITELVEAMLFDSNLFVLATGSFDIRECIDEVILLLAPEVHKSRAEIIAMVYPDIPLKLLGDASRLKQLLLNFAGSLLECNHEGDLLIRVFNESEQEDHVTLRIELIAHHIAQGNEDFEHLQALYNNDIACHSTGQIDGTMLANKIVQAMQGKVSIHLEPQERKLAIHFQCKLEKLYYPEEFYLTRDLLSRYRILIFDENPLTRAALTLQCRLFDMKVIDLNYNLPFDKLVQNILNHEIETFDLALIGINQFKFNEAKLRHAISQLRAVYSGPIIIAINTSDAHLLEDIEFCGADYCLIKPVSYKKLHNTFYDQLRFSTESIDQKNVTEVNIAQALVADDNPANLKRLVELLREEHFEVFSACSGEEAMKLIQAHHFDIAFLDIKMPEIDGFEVAKYIRQTKESTVPIIAVSAYLSNQEEGQLTQAGFDDFLTKPVKRGDIHAMLMKWLPALYHSADTQFAPMASFPSAMETASHSTGKSTRDHNQQGGVNMAIHSLSTTSINNTLPVIDWDLALNSANHNEAIAMEIFTMLIQSLPEVSNTIKRIYEKDDKKRLLEEIHKLHGSASYCGVPRLKQAAREAERALKAQEYQQLDLLIAELLHEINAVLQHAPAYMK